MNTNLDIFERMDRLPFTREHKKIWTIATGSWFVDGIFEGSPGYIVAAALVAFKFSSAISALIVSGFGIGLLIGTIVMSYVSDALGRRKIFQVDVLIFSLGALGMTLSPSWPFLFGFLIMASFGIAGLFAVDNAYISEVLPKNRRGFLQDGMIVSLVPGLMVAAVLYLLPSAFPALGFRIITLILAILGFIVFPFRRSLPESVRYLVSKKKYKEAEDFVKKLEASAGDAYRYDGGLIVPNVQKVARPRLTLFISKKYLMLMIYGMIGWFILFFAFTFNSYVPVILEVGIGVHSSTIVFVVILTLLADAASLVSRLFTTFTIDSLGRKFNMYFGFIVAGIGIAVWAYPWTHLHTVSFLYLVIPMMMFQFVNSWFMAFTVSYPELFPVELRSMAYGFPAGAGRVAAIVTPFLVLAFASNIGALFYIIAALSLAIGVAAFFVIPETKKQNIEHSSKDPLLDSELVPELQES